MRHTIATIIAAAATIAGSNTTLAAPPLSDCPTDSPATYQVAIGTEPGTEPVDGQKVVIPNEGVVVELTPGETGVDLSGLAGWPSRLAPIPGVWEMDLVGCDPAPSATPTPTPAPTPAVPDTLPTAGGDTSIARPATITIAGIGALTVAGITWRRRRPTNPA